RHAGYGVRPEHFDALGQALHATVRELDAAGWNGDVSAAWRRAYDFIATAMRQGLAGGGTTAISEVGAALPGLLRGLETPSPRGSAPAPTPTTRYTQSGEVSLAYQVFGE